jgi:hypothetical protein
MLPTTGGFFCPACKHRSSQSTIFPAGSDTPPLGLNLGPLDDEIPPDPSLLPDDSEGLTPVPGSVEPVGASIFDGKPAFEHEAPTPVPKPRPSPETFVDDEKKKPEPELRFVEDGQGQGAFGETLVIPGDKGSPSASGDDDMSPVFPENRDALFLPRCKSCNEVLELEDITDGECAKCRDGGVSKSGLHAGRRRARKAAPPAGATAIATGALAALATTWVGVLVVVRAVQVEPDAWGWSRFLMESWRVGLVLFALAASILWACGKSWAGGAALALGGLAAALAAVMLRSGELVGDIHAASAWMLAGAAGALAAVATMLPRTDPAASGRRRRGRAAARRKPKSTSEVMAMSSRRTRARGTGVNRLRAVLGGIVALAAAGVAGWRAIVAYGNAPGALSGFGPDALRVYGLGTTALFMGLVALWLFLSPPRGKTHVLALSAAVVAAPLPGWLVVGPRVAEAAGLGSVDANGWLILPAGLGRLVGMEYLAGLAPGAVPGQIKLAAAVALGLGLVASGVGLFTKSSVRGRGLAGLALAFALVWGAGLTIALAPREPSEPVDASAAVDDAGGAGSAAGSPDASSEAAPDPAAATAPDGPAGSAGSADPSGGSGSAF